MKQATLNKSNVTGLGARSSFEVQREAGDCQREALTLEYTIVSSPVSYTHLRAHETG